MGVPTQAKTLYKTSVGYSELPTVETQNAMGEKVVQPGGGIGIIDKRTGQMVPTTTKYVGGYGIVTPNYGTGSRATSALGGTAGATGAPGAGAGNALSGSGTGVVIEKKNGKDAVANAYQRAIDTTNEALGSAQGAVGKSEAKITNVQGDLGSARGATGGIGAAITNVNSAAANLSPYELLIKGHGTSLAGIYDALMGGDPSVGGIVGDYLGGIRDAADALAGIDPDRYAAMAGADVQAQFDNSRGQNERELARSGVSLGSGAQTALMNQFNRALATAKASAMTRARMQGITDKANALTQRAGLFEGVMKNAVSASDQSTQNFVQAAGIVEKQGDMFSTAGSLSNTQANAYANIGGVEVNLGQLDLSNEKLVQDAYAGAEAAMQALAKANQEMLDVTESNSGVKGNESTSMTTTKSYS